MTAILTPTFTTIYNDIDNDIDYDFESGIDSNIDSIIDDYIGNEFDNNIDSDIGSDFDNGITLPLKMTSTTILPATLTMPTTTLITTTTIVKKLLAKIAKNCFRHARNQIIARTTSPKLDKRGNLNPKLATWRLSGDPTLARSSSFH